MESESNCIFIMIQLSKTLNKKIISSSQSFRDSNEDSWKSGEKLELIDKEIVVG